MNDQKKMLIDSMRKLISHVSINKEHQIEIYCSLTKGDLVKILTNLEDHNPTLRKMSIRLICELLYKNHPLKEQFGELMAVRPVNGHIVINKIPEGFVKRPEKLMEAMELLKSRTESVQLASKNLCWFINPNQSQLTLQFVDSRDQELVDPKDNLMGITIAAEGNATKSIHESVVLELRASLKEHRPRTSITSTDTDRYSRGVKDIRSKREEDNMNLSREQYKIQSKPTPVKYEQRVRTDGSQHFRYRPTKGSSMISNGSPQSITLRGIEKSHREKKSDRQNSSVVQTPGHMSDRIDRVERIGGDTEMGFKGKNSFMSQIKNSYLIKDSSTRESRPKAELHSHRESFDNYKPSENFLRKYKEGDRRLY